MRLSAESRYAEVVEVVLDGLKLAAHFARGQRRVIGRQAGIEDRGGHKQSLVCFPSPLFYARPPARTSRETAQLNVPDQRPAANDARHVTETPSPGSLHPVCWTTYSSAMDR
jgi:hypothetical protein